MAQLSFSEKWTEVKKRLVAPWWHTLLVFPAVFVLIKFFEYLNTNPGPLDWLTTDANWKSLYLGVFANFLMFAIFGLGLLLYKTNFRSLIGVKKVSTKEFMKQAGITLAAWVVMALLYTGAYGLISLFMPVAPSAEMKSTFTAPSTILFILSILNCIVIAFVEEVVYRGYIQKQFIGLLNNIPIAILLQGIYFGFAHGYQGPVFIALETFAGVMYGVLAYNRKSLLPGMVVHFLNNALTIIGMTYGS